MSSLAQLGLIWHVVPLDYNHTWCISSCRGCFVVVFEWVWSTLHSAFVLQAPLIYPLVSPRFYWRSTCTPSRKWPGFDGLWAENDPVLLFFFFFFFKLELSYQDRLNGSPMLCWDKNKTKKNRACGCSQACCLCARVHCDNRQDVILHLK